MPLPFRPGTFSKFLRFATTDFRMQDFEARFNSSQRFPNSRVTQHGARDMLLRVSG